jgi:Xaa-Pro aminopeptidase
MLHRRYTLHRLSHHLGLDVHDSQVVVGEYRDGTIEPGMVFTIEPGLYSSEIGGFRHSDTVVVTPDGIEILTSYPKDIESLTIPA